MIHTSDACARARTRLILAHLKKKTKLLAPPFFFFSRLLVRARFHRDIFIRIYARKIVYIFTLLLHIHANIFLFSKIRVWTFEISILLLSGRSEQKTPATFPINDTFNHERVIVLLLSLLNVFTEVLLYNVF